MSNNAKKEPLRIRDKLVSVSKEPLRIRDKCVSVSKDKLVSASKEPLRMRDKLVSVSKEALGNYTKGINQGSIDYHLKRHNECITANVTIIYHYKIHH